VDRLSIAGKIIQSLTIQVVTALIDAVFLGGRGILYRVTENFPQIYFADLSEIELVLKLKLVLI